MAGEFRKAVVYSNGIKAGILEETGTGYRFAYDKAFIKQNVPVSVSLPLKEEAYESRQLFPFFQGLLPEGWFLDIVASTLKIDKDDDFGILLAACRETVGAVTVEKI